MGPNKRNGKTKSSNKKDTEKEKKWKYDGNYSTIETFKEKVKSDVEYASDLGVALLTGVIAVNIINTMAKCFTKQLAPIMGKAQHAKYIISETNTDITPQIQSELTTAIDRSTLEVIVKKLKEMKPDATETEINTEIDNILHTSSGGVHFKNSESARKTKATPIKAAPTKTRSEFINLICNNEPEELTRQRYQLGIFNRSEFEEEFLDEMDTAESTKFRRTGMIPKEQLKTAMTEINNAVKNRITDKVKRNDTRLKTIRGMKHGLEIYTIIQKPTNTNIRNIVYLTNRIKKVQKWQNVNFHKYWLELNTLVEQRHEAIKAMNPHLPEHQIWVITEVLSRMETTEGYLPTHHSLVNLEYAKMKNCDDFGNRLMELVPMKTNKSNNKNNDKNDKAENSEATVANATTQKKTKNGKVLECMACGGNHWLC